MVKIGIVGGTGYTGVELLRLLGSHPEADVRAITSRGEAGTAVAAMFPSLRGRYDLAFTDPAKTDLTQCDVVLFEKWYKLPHTCPDLLAESVYGLPEFHREEIRKARVVGNPGCYPTSIQLGFIPLLEAGIVDTEHLIADCKSGASGAGRKAEVGLLLAESSDNFKAYGVSGHRHHPETVQELAAHSATPVKLVFTPHLLPMIRGIHSTLYARLTRTDVDLQSLFEKRYAGEPFVDVMPAGSMPDTRSVRASNVARIAVHRPGNGDMVTVLVVEDNLVKGAAGQAIQNMNLMFGLPETTGLTALPVLP
jgi:N-acetyl-gamma-glutamyl-phosphate reductase